MAFLAMPPLVHAQTVAPTGGAAPLVAGASAPPSAPAPSTTKAAKQGASAVPEDQLRQYLTQYMKFLGDDYKYCDVDCLLERGNERLLLYIFNGLDEVKHIQNALKDCDDQHPPDEVCRKAKDIVPALFCNGEAARSCAERYIRHQFYVLRDAYRRQSKNRHNSESYQSAVPDQKAVFHDTGDMADEGKKLQSATIPTHLELQKYYENEKEAFRYTTRDGYLSYVESIRKEPSKEDFAEFTKIPRDPDQPALGYLEVAKTDCGQPLCYNEKAYRKALVEHQKIFGKGGTGAKDLATEKRRADEPQAKKTGKIETVLLPAKILQEKRADLERYRDGYEKLAVQINCENRLGSTCNAKQLEAESQRSSGTPRESKAPNSMAPDAQVQKYRPTEIRDTTRPLHLRGDDAKISKEIDDIGRDAGLPIQKSTPTRP